MFFCGRELFVCLEPWKALAHTPLLLDGIIGTLDFPELGGGMGQELIAHPLGGQGIRVELYAHLPVGTLDLFIGGSLGKA